MRVTTDLHDNLTFTYKNTDRAATVAKRRGVPDYVAEGTLTDPEYGDRHSTIKILAHVLADPEWEAARATFNVRDVLDRAEVGAALTRAPGFNPILVTTRTDKTTLQVVHPLHFGRLPRKPPPPERVPLDRVLATMNGVTIFAAPTWTPEPTEPEPRARRQARGHRTRR